MSKARPLSRELAEQVAQEFGVAPATARALTAFVLRAVAQDMAAAAIALDKGDPDLGTAARTLAVRFGYAADRAASQGPRKT